MSTATKPANVVCDPVTGVCRYVPEATLQANDATPATSTTQPATSSHPNLKHLGTELLGQKGAKVPTSSLLGAGKYIGLYFSAHWCPPCRMFTPALAKFYTDFKASHPQKDNFDIIFVSSDRDQKSFDDYFDSMPWLALPFEDRTAKSKLSSKFKVRGIPTFVVLNAETGELVTTDGRSAIASDPTGDNFPWAPRTFLEAIQPATLVNAAGAKHTYEQALAGKVALVYFSAHWCPPCRQFTPQLVTTYNALKAVGRPAEVVFVSRPQRGAVQGVPARDAVAGGEVRGRGAAGGAGRDLRRRGLPHAGGRGRGRQDRHRRGAAGGREGPAGGRLPLGACPAQAAGAADGRHGGPDQRGARGAVRGGRCGGGGARAGAAGGPGGGGEGGARRRRAELPVGLAGPAAAEQGAGVPGRGRARGQRARGQAGDCGRAGAEEVRARGGAGEQGRGGWVRAQVLGWGAAGGVPALSCGGCPARGWRRRPAGQPRGARP